MKRMLVLLTLAAFVAGCSGIGKWSASGKTKKKTKAGAPWEGVIVKYEEQDRKNPPAEGGVVFIGDAAVAKWSQIEKDFEDLKLPVVARGFGGSTMEDALRYVHRIVTPYKPSKVVVFEGDNDVWRKKDPVVVLEQLKKLVAEIRSTCPDTVVYVMSVKPSPKRGAFWTEAGKLNELFAAYAGNTDKVEYVDVSTPLLKDGQPDEQYFLSDKLNLNRNGYKVLIPVVRAALVGPVAE